MKNRFLLIALAILSMGLFVTSNVRAQDEPAGTATGTSLRQPQSAVGRLSVIHGNVSTMHGDGTANGWRPR